MQEKDKEYVSLVLGQLVFDVNRKQIQTSRTTYKAYGQSSYPLNLATGCAVYFLGVMDVLIETIKVLIISAYLLRP